MSNKKIKLVVYNENTLGYILPELPTSCQILSASVIKGATSGINQGYMPIRHNDTVRLATRADFKEYRVEFESYAKSGEYDYLSVDTAQEVEKELRRKWAAYEDTCHPEDSMCFTDYVANCSYWLRDHGWKYIYESGNFVKL